MSTSAAPLSPSGRPRGPHSGMRAGRLVLLSMAAILAVLIAVIWILPGMLDWNRYRGSIAGLVAAGIGRPVRIDGNITLHLLPQPFLTATDLEVDDAGDGVVLHAKAIRLRVALGPLIAGRVDARELTLQGADLRLPWPPPPGALSRRPPAWITGLQARVEESRLRIGNFVLSGIDASLGADPETGTLSAAGSATLFNLPTRFTTRLGRPGRDGAAPIDISLDGLDKLRDTGGTVSGAVEADGSLNGRVTARGSDLSQLVPAPAAAWRGDGRISASSGIIVADELAIEIAGAPARGAVALRVQPDLRLDIALTAGRLNLDEWTPVLLRAAQPGRVTSFPTGIDLSAEAATLAGGALRQVRAGFDIDGDGVTLRDATAIVPGEAKLTLAGHFPNKGRAVSFEGNGTLIAPDLRGTLRWLEPVAPALIHVLPDAALRTANLSAKIGIDPAQLSFTDLKGTLDGADAQGGVAVRLGPKLAVSGGLTLDRLLLDPWLPDLLAFDRPVDAYTTAVKSLASAGFDTDLKLQVKQANWRGAHFGPLAFDVQSEAGRLTVRRFEVSAAGLHATASGTLGEAGRVSEGRLELTAQEVAPLQPFLPRNTAWVAPLLHGPASVLMLIAGPAEALGVKATLDLGDLRVEAQPVFNLVARRWAGPLTLHHPGASRLLAELGFGDVTWLGDGSCSVIAQLSHIPGRLDANSIELVAGETRLTGQLWDFDHVIQGKLKAETLTLPAIDLRSTDPLPLATLGARAATIHLDADRALIGMVPGITDLAMDAEVRNGAVGVTGLTAKLGGGTLALSAKLQPGDPPSLSLEGQTDGIGISGPVLGGPLDVVAGTLTSKSKVSGEGFSPATLVATLTGSGVATVANAGVVGFDVPAIQEALTHAEAKTLAPALRDALLSGSTVIPTLTLPFDLQRGVLTTRAQGGAAALNTSVDLIGGTVNGRLTVSPGPELPELPVRLSGKLANPVRTPELAGAARWLAERP